MCNAYNHPASLIGKTLEVSRDREEDFQRIYRGLSGPFTVVADNRNWSYDGAAIRVVTVENKQGVQATGSILRFTLV